MTNEIIETAKATQEVAKATVKGIEGAEKLGNFFSKVFGEPIETAVGILDDKLKYMRFERKVRFAEKVIEINHRRGISGKEIPVQPKIAIPIIEHASLEESDELQNLWANLLSSAQNENKEKISNYTYIEILKQLNMDEANILNSMREYILNEFAIEPTQNRQSITFDQMHIMTKLGIKTSQDQENIADNLKRLGLIRKVDVNEYGYDVIQITVLGMKFTEACISF